MEEDGLDVSEAEPALFVESDDNGYEIYKSVEDKVRTAVELDNRLDLLLRKVSNPMSQN